MESGCAQDIKKVVHQGYAAEFPLFEKIEVNGKQTHPIYAFLRTQCKQMNKGSEVYEIPFNFSKFLIDGRGKVYSYYGPTVEPFDIVSDIEFLMSQINY